ncbi:MAG: methyltransferase domain-containing protein [Aquificae bacterium]|nr:methyltransferase domain-containing protein [Aquificota bacterium]
MEKDRLKWNERYKENDLLPQEPSNIVKHFYNLAPKGRALDIAAGNGRNSLFLAQKGFYVDAVDISDVAIDKIKKLNNKNINPILADLDSYEIEENKYDLVININFLNRNLFPSIKESLKPNGVLIFETFLLDKYSHIKTKNYLLRKNELLQYFIDFRIIFYQEKNVQKLNRENATIASLVAIKECKLI